MEAMTTFATCIVVFGLAITTCAWKLVKWFWVRPRRLERCLRRQGLNGNQYRLLFGDMKENSKMITEARSKPIHLSDDITPRVVPFLFETLNNHGKDSFVWFGPIPRVNIMNPEHIKEIFMKLGDFRKPQLNPLVYLLISGLLKHEDEKWAMHRKIINPAFHMEKLKGMLPAIHISCEEMLNKWESLVNGSQGSCEIDVWPYIQNLTGDVISRTAFGRSYEDGRRIFQLITELAPLVMKSLLVGCFPGWRFLPTKLNIRMKNIDKEMQGLLKHMIRDRENTMKSGDAPNNDLLGILID